MGIDRTPGMSWGLVQGRGQRVLRVTDRLSPPPFAGGGPFLAFGNGRSYGDSCLVDGGTLVDTSLLDRFIEFDPQEGVIACESGVTLAEISALATPHGWFLPVTPGTQFVTLGGAIANDVHGKNHHRAGSFGCHVESLELIRTDGAVHVCSADRNAPLYRATIGGLGLTGLIRWARIRLKRVPSTSIAGATSTFHSVEEFLEQSRESNLNDEYSAAWLDCSSSRFRGVLISGSHAPTGALRASEAIHRPRWRVPPVRLVWRPTIRAFNALYFLSQRLGSGKRTWSAADFLYPLDAIRGWNRSYGKRGFFQHQSVVPAGAAAAALNELFAAIRDSHQGSTLTVLKVFGSRVSGGLLSFARSGVTLAVDFANLGDATRSLLARLDDIVVAAGGAVYPAKDARMSPACFRASFPGLAAFAEHVDPGLSSNFWRRVTA